MTIEDKEDKDIDIGRAKNKRRIRSNDNEDLAARIDSLQRAFANERGIREQHHQETLTILRILLQRRYPG